MVKKRKAAPSPVDLDEVADSEVIDSELDFADSDDEVSNAMDVPLFSGAGFANNRAIAKLRLVKLDNPGAGYKGEIPTSSTLETIGQLFGDGVYNIEAVNARGFRLRVLENQRISLGLGPMDGSRVAPAAVAGPSAAELDRVERLSRQAAAESVQQANAHTRLVQETSQAAAAREREFMQGANAQTQQFFASILAAMTQGHQQQLAMMQASHTHTMEMMIAMRAGNGEESSAERMLALFAQGLNLGRSLDQPDERPFWQEILQGGVGLLAGAKQQSQAALPKLSKGSGQSNGSSAGKDKLRRIVLAMRRRGIDPDQLLDMLEGGDKRPEPDEPEESEDEPSGPIFTGSGDTDADTD